MAVRSREVPASSSPAIDAVALHDSNESTLVECVVAALRQARSDGRDIHAKYCRSIFQRRDFATVIALPLALLQCLLVVAYDEHGGFYDHVPAQPAEDDNPSFRHYGARVPALIVSP